ncbi:hypothetical protein TNCV_3892091 [Trichonephila clavipes]|nr:hypothetical protein TNCV_3892091 [Trichonephila clavipes]
MEQSNKNITNADSLASEREMNLAKENGERQQTNVNDENMQDLDDQQPSEKRYCSARGHQGPTDIISPVPPKITVRPCPCYSFSVLYTLVSVLSCPGKTCSSMASIEQWYYLRAMAPKTHTVKQVLHSPFTDCRTGTIFLQLDGNLR